MIGGIIRRLRAALRRLVLGTLPSDVLDHTGQLERLRTQCSETVRELQKLQQRVSEEALATRRLILAQRPLFIVGPDEHGAACDLAPEPDAPTLDEVFTKLRGLAPHAYGPWRELLDVNGQEYHGFPPDSCSVDGHFMAELFRAFVRPYLRGPVLDVGCGPQPVPLYLQDHEPALLAGIDPLRPPTPHPFAFAQGFAEFLPWKDATFQVVVAATSLDHVLDLERTLDEVRRVLRPDGRFVVWTSFVPGAVRYDPHRPDVKKVDKFHLFHFDLPWFEQVFGERFVVEEAFRFAEPWTDAFYSFGLRASEGSRRVRARAAAERG